MNKKNCIVQHCFGKNNSGGPVVALEHLISKSGMNFDVIRQIEGANGIDLKLLRKFFLKLKELKPELIHVRGLGNEGFHAVLAARLAGVPNILVSIHGTHRDLKYPNNKIKHWLVVHILESLTILMATHIATVCEYAAARPFLKRHYKKLVAVVPNGVDLPNPIDFDLSSIRSEFNIPNNIPIGISVSRITKEKGYLILASALHKLDSTGCPFVVLIVGDGDENLEIRDSFNGLKNISVHFLGHRHDVGNFLRQSDFFIFPSLHENLSNALLEAMSHGLPVIATQTGGNTELVEQGGGGADTTK